MIDPLDAIDAHDEIRTLEQNRRVRRRGLLDPERRLAHRRPVPRDQLQDARPFFKHVPCLIIPVFDRESFRGRARLVLKRDVGAEGYQTSNCGHGPADGRPH